jgi:hypothetical protein
MNKERELLIQALEDWDFSDKVETLDPIFEEIRTYLSTPSDDAEEPVGYAVKMIPKGLHFIGFVGEEETDEEIEEYGPDQIVPLYLYQPKPAEPEAAPVAYINLDEKRLEWAVPFEFKSSCFVLGKLPLYLHPPKPAELELEEYDAGLLGYFGGGDVEWWQDYIRDLLGRAHDHYQSQVSAYPPKPAEPEARKPMTPKERSDGYMELEGILGPDAHLMSFLSGICAAEKHHGITDADL